MLFYTKRWVYYRVGGKAKIKFHLSKKQCSSSFRFTKFSLDNFRCCRQKIIAVHVSSLRFLVDGVALSSCSYLRVGQNDLHLFLKVCPFRILLGFGLLVKCFRFLQTLRLNLFFASLNSCRLFKGFQFSITLCGLRFGSFPFGFKLLNFNRIAGAFAFNNYLARTAERFAVFK